MPLSHAVSLSNRQYTLLDFFVTRGANYVMSLETLGEYDQRTAGSLARRADAILVRTSDGSGLKLSEHGRTVARAFKDTDVTRKHPSMDLSQWLSQYLFAPERKPRGRPRALPQKIAARKTLKATG